MEVLHILMLKKKTPGPLFTIFMKISRGINMHYIHDAEFNICWQNDTGEDFNLLVVFINFDK